MSGRGRSQWLTGIAVRADAATPGPWTARGVWLSTGPEWAGEVAAFAREEDAEFIAHARTDVPRLLAELDRLQERLERQRDSTRKTEVRFVAAARELTKEIADARGLSYRAAMLVARDLIDENVRLRTRGGGRA